LPDALMAVAMLLEILSHTDIPLSTLLDREAAVD
jgi:hypothetical protein